MNIRPKTIRRLMFLFAGFVLLAGVLALLIVRTIHRQEAQIDGLRTAAFKAFEAKDYPTAVSLFHDYFARAPEDTDSEAIYAYGHSTVQTIPEGSGQVYEAIRLMQQYLARDPQDKHDASHELLKLYLDGRYNEEARNLATRLLAKDPSDTVALRARAQANLNDEHYADSLAAWHQLNAIDPANLGWQQAELGVMFKLKKPNDQIIDHAHKLLDAHPNDPRFDALMAIALKYTGQEAEGNKYLEQAAKLPPADADSALEIVALLDEIARFDLSDPLLSEAMTLHPDPRLTNLSLKRMFERQQYSQLLDHLPTVDVKSPTTPAIILAMKVIALEELKRANDAKPILVALSSRKDDAAIAWSEALVARYDSQTQDLPAMLKAFGDAVSRQPGNPIFHLYLGEAQAAMGERDQAIGQWITAARQSRTWIVPLYEASVVLSDGGQYEEAFRFAVQLMQRAPNSIAAQTAFCLADWGLIQKDNHLATSSEGDRLLKLLESVRKASINDSRTLAAYVGLLALRGERDKAIDAAKQALAADPPPGEKALAALSAVSDEQHLDLTGMILDSAERSHGLVPTVAYTRALSLYQSGKTAEAMQMVEGLQAAHSSELAWQIAEARFRDRIGDPDAAKSWAAIADGNANNLQLQLQALGSPSRSLDRPLWKRLIDRTRSLTGADAPVWQMEQTRYHLAGQTSQQDLDADAAALLKLTQVSPELADAHNLLAQVSLRSVPANLDRAVTELTAAHELQPDDFAIAAQLTPLLLSQGLNDRANAIVDGVARSAHLPMDRRLWAAQTYQEMGNLTAAISLLTDSSAAQNDIGRDAVLADLYARNGQADKAAELYLKLVDDPKAGLAPLAAGAQFFAVEKKPDQVERFVARLRQMPSTPGAMEDLEAKLELAEGRTQEAIKTLTDAAEAHPQIEPLWLDLAGTYLRLGAIDEADQAAARGFKAVPGSIALAKLREQVAKLRKLDGRDALPLLAPLAQNPGDAAVDAELRVLIGGQPAVPLLVSLRQIADKYPGFLPAQELVVRRYMESHQLHAALDVANRSNRMAPNNPQAARLLFRVEMAAGEWEAARAAAQHWRDNSPADPMEADIALAQVDLQQTSADPAAAILRLDRYVAESAPQPQREAATPIYCRALLAAGRMDDAAERLKPLVSQSSKWAVVWLDLTLSGNSTAEAAEAWLRKLVPLIPADTVQTKLNLAIVWAQVGMKFDTRADDETARGLLAPIIAQPDAPAEAWRWWALCNAALDNLPEADRAWQQFLKVDPNNPDAQNNYAFVLLLEGGEQNLARAGQLAAAAIASRAEASTYYDTLARIQLQSGKPADATRNFRLALDKDPNDVEAMIGLADLLQTTPAGRDEARSLLTRINVIVAGGAPLAPTIRKELDRVKTALSSTL